MGFNWCRSTCCFCSLYKRCFPGAYNVGKNKTSPGEPSPSPPPSIALTVASRSQADEVSIQDQLEVFHFGNNGRSPSGSGRRYSHPNQAKWVEVYERSKSLSGSPAPSLNEDMDSHKPEESPPPSPVMLFPLIPPGIPF